MKIIGNIHRHLRRTYNRMRLSWHTQMRQRQSAIRSLLRILDIATFFGALGFMVCFVLYIGYEHSPSQLQTLYSTMHSLRWLFALNITFRLAINFRQTIAETRIVKWIVDTGILVSVAIPLLHTNIAASWPALANVLSGQWLNIGILLAYSIVDISYAVMRIMNRRTNPPLMMSGSFLVFIIIGSILLTLPKATYNGLQYTDALFVSTSAVCITGLTTVDIPATFTPFGQGVLALLIQIGGLGVLTFTSFFAIFFSGNTSIYSQLLVKDMISSKSVNALMPTLLYIFMFTIVVELTGALAVWWTTHDYLTHMSPGQQISFSLFHSLSAFCNAGFCTLPGGMSNPALLNSNQSVYLVTSIIVLAGGIGFPVLVNIRDAFSEYIHRLFNRVRRRKTYGRQIHLYNLNTKLSLYATIILFLLSTIAFFIFERQNSMNGMSTYTQVCQSIFNATCPRSSGFQSISPVLFSPATFLIVLLLMWIGGASQSTAGGIKVNTLSASLLTLRATILGKNKVTAYNRTISTGSIRRANAIVTLSLLALFVYTTALLLLEPGLPPKAVIFETVSALFTVGSSLGITDQLSDISKITLCSAMFLGRVGIISLLIGITGNQTNAPIDFPTDNVIIN